MIALEAARVGSGETATVPPITARFAAGTITALAVETAERPMLVSLLISGRLRPDGGTVTIDGHADAAALRRAVALVDTPVVAEPVSGVMVRSVVAEELALAGRRSTRRAVRAVLDAHGIAEYARRPIGVLPPADRVRLLVELAVARPSVTAVVLTSPERHGGSPAHWYPALSEVATRGLTVVIVTDQATSDVIRSLEL